MARILKAVLAAGVVSALGLPAGAAQARTMAPVDPPCVVDATGAPNGQANLVRVTADPCHRNVRAWISCKMILGGWTDDDYTNRGPEIDDIGTSVARCDDHPYAYGYDVELDGGGWHSYSD